MKENFQKYVQDSKMDVTEITLPKSFDNALQNHEIIMNGGIYSSLKKVYKEDKEKSFTYCKPRQNVGRRSSKIRE